MLAVLLPLLAQQALGAPAARPHVIMMLADGACVYFRLSILPVCGADLAAALFTLTWSLRLLAAAAAASQTGAPTTRRGG